MGDSPAPSPGPGRVLMTADAVGGVWTYVLELARGLCARGVAVDVAVMGPAPDAAKEAQARTIPGLRLFAGPYRLEWMDDPWEDVDRAGEWLLGLAEATRPDLVHLNGYCHAHLDWGRPVLLAAHSCVLSWWRAVKGEPAPPDRDHYKERVARGLRAAGGVVAPSLAMLHCLSAEYGPLPGGEVIPNCRDAALFSPGAKREIAFAAGRFWDEAKNLSGLARVADQLCRPLVLAGDHGGNEPAYSANLRRLGFLSAEMVRAWFARAAVYALPARYEPFGLSVLEAALCGCALVLGDIPSLRENWAGAALFVSPDDHQALTRAVNRLFYDPRLRRRLAAKARRRALSFTPERTVSGYLAAYRRLLHPQPAAAA